MDMCCSQSSNVGGLANVMYIYALVLLKRVTSRALRFCTQYIIQINKIINKMNMAHMHLTPFLI